MRVRSDSSYRIWAVQNSVQQKLDNAIHEIDGLKIALMQAERERDGAQVLVTNFQRKNASLQDLDARNK